MRDDLAEQSLGERGNQQGHHSRPTGGLAGDGHPRRVTAERTDVVTHPFQAGDQVTQAAVGGCVIDPAEAVEPQPVGERHRDDTVAVVGHTVVPRA